MDEDLNMPVFVKIEDYRNLIEVVDLLKKKLEEARRSLEKIVELKGKEDEEIEMWQAELAEVERKIEFIDNALFEQGSL